MEPGSSKSISSVVLGWATFGIGVFVYLTQKDIVVAIGSAIVGGTLLNNFIVLLFPTRVSSGYLRNVISTSYIATFVFLALTLFESVRVFLDRFGFVGRYGLALLLGISFVLALRRQQQLKVTE